MTRSRTLLVGIGSPHGDDQIGWLVADCVSDTLRAEVEIEVKKASSPSDLLDWLENVARLYVCDACQTPDSAIRSTESSLIDSGLYRWQWPAPLETPLRSSGSHTFGLPQVLQLAQRLRILPENVVVYGIAGARFNAFTDVSRELSACFRDFAAIISRDLADGMRIPMRESARHA
jgi:hydrogenase maturation protease